MTLRFGGIVIREVPAKSAPAYEHQLQQNAKMRGSKDFLPVLDFPLDFELVEDKHGPPLIIGVGQFPAIKLPSQN